MNKLHLPKITPSRLFFTLYILISAATFRHSTIGFASLEGSNEWGALSALAVDVLMILFAHALRQDGFSWRKSESWGLAFGLAIPAAASVYTQLLFAVTEAQLMEIAPGALWLNQRAIDITNIRVVLLPALLPILALVAALMGKHESAQVVPAAEHNALKVQLDLVRQQAAQLRKETAESAVTHDATVARARELERIMERLRSPETTTSATSLIRVLSEDVYNNGSAPTTGVLAEALGVSAQTVRKAWIAQADKVEPF